MTQRDKAIIADLKRFRVMTRDDIADVHFGGIKNSITEANRVLKRLRRDRLITCDPTLRKYNYFPLPRIKEQSSKIAHYLAIVSFYRAIRKVEEPRFFSVELHLGDKFPEPDIEMLWMNKPFFIEIQRNVFNDKEIKEKFARYERYYESEKWKDRPWQKSDKQLFPHCIMISDRTYKAPDLPFRFIQLRRVEDLIELVKI